MSCPYYTWRSDYYCIKQEREVPSDTYYKYCRNYDYDDCPIYKDGDLSASSEGCYLTSDCVRAMGLPDDCHELTVLRRFRDTYLKGIPGGAEEICEYYHIAPTIVAAIDQKNDRLAILRRIYENMVLPCVNLIEAKQFEQAHLLYREQTVKLKAYIG